MANEVTFRSVSISCGVPQGSVVRPLLFLIYVNDVTCWIENGKIRLYADDTCRLQDDLNNLTT